MKFKIGDKVRRIHWSYGPMKVGDIHEISKTERNSGIVYLSGHNNGFLSTNFELTSKFRVGDRVRFCGTMLYDFIKSSSYIKRGEIFTISLVFCVSGETKYNVEGSIFKDGELKGWRYMDEEFELVTERNSKSETMENESIKNVEDLVKNMDKSIIKEAQKEVLEERSNLEKEKVKKFLNELLNRKDNVQERLDEINKELKEINGKIKPLMIKN